MEPTGWFATRYRPIPGEPSRAGGTGQLARRVRDVQCVILCGGFATRLRPLTLDRPKHLLPIAGRPMLDHLLDRLGASGITSGVLVTNHRFISNFADWATTGK